MQFHFSNFLHASSKTESKIELFVVPKDFSIYTVNLTQG